MEFVKNETQTAVFFPALSTKSRRIHKKAGNPFFQCYIVTNCVEEIKIPAQKRPRKTLLMKENVFQGLPLNIQILNLPQIDKLIAGSVRLKSEQPYQQSVLRSKSSILPHLRRLQQPQR